MVDFVDIYVSRAAGYHDDMFVGNPAGHLFLEDDSNSEAGIPDDWTTDPQLRATKRGAFIVVVSNIECEVALCGPTELPDNVSFVRLRLPAGGIVQYSAHITGGRSRVFVRRRA